MSRPVSRRYFLAASVAALAPMLAACGQPAAPASPTQSQPPATRAAAPVAVTAGPAAAKPADATPAAKVQAAGQGMGKAPANKTELVIATPADIARLDPHMGTSFQDI